MALLPILQYKLKDKVKELEDRIDEVQIQSRVYTDVCFANVSQEALKLWMEDSSATVGSIVARLARLEGVTACASFDKNVEGWGEVRDELQREVALHTCKLESLASKMGNVVCDEDLDAAIASAERTMRDELRSVSFANTFHARDELSATLAGFESQLATLRPNMSMLSLSSLGARVSAVENQLSNCRLTMEASDSINMQSFGRLDAQILAQTSRVDGLLAWKSLVGDEFRPLRIEEKVGANSALIGQLSQGLADLRTHLYDSLKGIKELCEHSSRANSESCSLIRKDFETRLVEADRQLQKLEFRTSESAQLHGMVHGLKTELSAASLDIASVCREFARLSAMECQISGSQFTVETSESRKGQTLCRLEAQVLAQAARVDELVAWKSFVSDELRPSRMDEKVGAAGARVSQLGQELTNLRTHVQESLTGIKELCERTSQSSSESCSLIRKDFETRLVEADRQVQRLDCPMSESVQLHGLVHGLKTELSAASLDIASVRREFARLSATETHVQESLTGIKELCERTGQANLVHKDFETRCVEAERRVQGLERLISESTQLREVIHTLKAEQEATKLDIAFFRDAVSRFSALESQISSDHLAIEASYSFNSQAFCRLEAQLLSQTSLVQELVSWKSVVSDGLRDVCVEEKVATDTALGGQLAQNLVDWRNEVQDNLKRTRELCERTGREGAERCSALLEAFESRSAETDRQIRVISGQLAGVRFDCTNLDAELKTQAQSALKQFAARSLEEESLVSESAQLRAIVLALKTDLTTANIDLASLRKECVSSAAFSESGIKVVSERCSRLEDSKQAHILALKSLEEHLTQMKQQAEASPKLPSSPESSVVSWHIADLEDRAKTAEEQIQKLKDSCVRNERGMNALESLTSRVGILESRLNSWGRLERELTALKAISPRILAVEVERKSQGALKAFEEPIVDDMLSSLAMGVVKLAQFVGVLADEVEVDHYEKVGWREACLNMSHMMDQAWFEAHLPKRTSVLRMLKQKADSDQVQDLKLQLEAFGEILFQLATEGCGEPCKSVARRASPGMAPLCRPSSGRRPRDAPLQDRRMTQAAWRAMSSAYSARKPSTDGMQNTWVSCYAARGRPRDGAD